ncbi:16S rRNA (cytosine(967)-C(5))-methyltransferase RsmB [Virgibacillus halotolerans]|uniref:16S rRNA (cytosine(967)-C(5))-methyltransferase RsmB n=1 Tax=Virgibacillus halotolerans TaxID=1071053 RepID=UPI00195FC941|nr:16S rRNA (cytosine(967)-C(5))-methyltransferase RsmB [Virgibacillus halotolerans]
MNDFSLRNTIVDLLVRIEKDHGFSHLLIDHTLRTKQVDPRDEGLLTEIVYGTIQRQFTIDYYLAAFVDPKKKLDIWVKSLLRMSVYQMVFLDKVPDHAIIHEAVEIAKKRGHKGIASFVNGVLRTIQRKGVPDTASIEDQSERLAVETSHPQWLVDRWVTNYGYPIAKEMCEANLARKTMSVRIQPLRITREEAMKRLNEEGLETRQSIFSPQGIIIEKGNVLKTALFQAGYITIQDQSSMLVAEMLHAAPGMDVLDACSAPGGKVTHIAEKMEDNGHIYAYDLHKKKIKEVDEKASLLQLSIIDAQAGDARKLQAYHENESFDRILVDAPCSGLGVIRGKPEIKYDKQLADVERLSTIQSDILQGVAPLLKKGGLLIYSTCTVDKQENEAVVKQFLEDHLNYKVDEQFFNELPNDLKTSPGISQEGLQIFPQTNDTDGFFLTRLVKSEK